MASTAKHAEALREHATRTIETTTTLIADLRTLAEGLETLLPVDADRTESERWREIARLTGVDATMPERLAALVEALADVVAGLTSTDNGAGWLAHQRARLSAGDEDATAA